MDSARCAGCQQAMELLPLRIVNVQEINTRMSTRLPNKELTTHSPMMHPPRSTASRTGLLGELVRDCPAQCEGLPLSRGSLQARRAIGSVGPLPPAKGKE